MKSSQKSKNRSKYLNCRGSIGAFGRLSVPSGPTEVAGGSGNILGIILRILEGTETAQMAETCENWHDCSSFQGSDGIFGRLSGQAEPTECKEGSEMFVILFFAFCRSQKPSKPLK